MNNRFIIDQTTNTLAKCGVNTISYGTFKGCKNLKEAHFRIVKSIRDGVFEGCSSLETLKSEMIFVLPFFPFLLLKADIEKAQTIRI